MAVTPTTETTEAPHGGGGGLPQFDAAWWPGQIFWFLVIFLVVFLLMRLVFVPRVGGAIREREDRISGDIARARQLKEQAEAQSASAEAELDKAREKAQKMASDAKAKVHAEAHARQLEHEAELDKKVAEAEATIRKSRDAAMAQVPEIAAATAAGIVAKLTGRPVTAAELASAGGA
ncbi:MAG: F0F1 ATP synthase subunit B family protein [Phenylobacterium sp.]